MRTLKINQFAYVGYFATVDGQDRIITGQTILKGGATVPRPRLYETAEAALEAAEVMGTEAVLLVRKHDFIDTGGGKLKDMRRWRLGQNETDQEIDKLAR